MEKGPAYSQQWQFFDHRPGLLNSHHRSMSLTASPPQNVQ